MDDDIDKKDIRECNWLVEQHAYLSLGFEAAHMGKRILDDISWGDVFK